MLWDNDPAAEKSGTLAACRVLAEIDRHLSDRLKDVIASYSRLPDDS